MHSTELLQKALFRINLFYFSTVCAFIVTSYNKTLR